MTHHRKSVFPGDNPLMVHVVERGVVSRISEALKWDIYGHTVAALMLLTRVIGLGSACQRKHSETHEHQEANPRGRLGEAEDKVTQQTQSTESLGRTRRVKLSFFVLLGTPN